MLGNLHVRFGVGGGVESVPHHENRILREKLGPKRVRLNDSQRAHLGEAAAKPKKTNPIRKLVIEIHKQSPRILVSRNRKVPPPGECRLLLTAIRR